ncbi:helix-turn-helix domain-containing protein [Dactylosporangium sp. NPDC049140]|uniref:helix-turn-helix domain-containing protein n=1 Tax=Dactylosporangium sp. NPDC049140 TaxID=3155647 RepID=UPI0033F4EE84
MEIEDLGGRLRTRRTAAGRTIASVAAEAGLSVPYIANLENGRGNPTLSTVNSLAAALGLRLVVDLVEGDDEAPEPALPESLVQFARSPRFRREAERLPPPDRLLRAMAGMAALTDREPSELDWHRLLDAAVLIGRH